MHNYKYLKIKKNQNIYHFPFERKISQAAIISKISSHCPLSSNPKGPFLHPHPHPHHFISSYFFPQLLSSFVNPYPWNIPPPPYLLRIQRSKTTPMMMGKFGCRDKDGRINKVKWFEQTQFKSSCQPTTIYQALNHTSRRIRHALDCSRIKRS